MSRFREDTIDTIDKRADELRTTHTFGRLEPIDYLLIDKLVSMLDDVNTKNTDSDDVYEFLESAGF